MNPADTHTATAMTAGLTAPLVVIVVTIALAAGLTAALHRGPTARVARHFQRWMPLIQVALWTVAAMVVIIALGSALSDAMLILMGLVVVAISFGASRWLRAAVAGVALALENRVHPGDTVRVADFTGEVTWFGLRYVRLKSADGAIRDVPNQTFISETVTFPAGEGQDTACEISVQIPEGVATQTALKIAAEAAVLSPLATPHHTPEVFLQPAGEVPGVHRLRIRGYAFAPVYDEHYRSDVLARVEEALAHLIPGKGGAKPEFEAPTDIIISPDES